MLGFNVKYAILNGGRSRAGIEVEQIPEPVLVLLEPTFYRK